MIKVYPTLYKLDSVGRLRTWAMELNVVTGQYRTLAGLADGKQATSEWTTPVVASQSTVQEQGRFEVDSKYKHQLDREYHETADTVATAKIIEPMLAKTYVKFPSAGYMQPKLDGIRCIATKDGLFSRQGQRHIATPHIEEALAPIFAKYPDLVLDGELYNHDLREDFGAISSIVRKKNPTPEQLAKARDVMQYHVYDLVDSEGQTFSERNFLVKSILTATDTIKLVETYPVNSEADADTFNGDFIEAGYEGSMFRLDAPYELGRRSKSLLKRKDFITEEFPVVAIEEGNGNWSGAAKRYTLRNKDGSTFGAGTRGSREEAAAILAAGITDKSVATLRYFMLSPDGVPRFPVVIDFHREGRKD